jgi:radical SAM protein with 4Fe4S-binding SPASM domain
LGSAVNKICRIEDSKNKAEKFKINESAIDIIKNINGVNSFNDISDALSQEYDMDQDEILNIVLDFVKDNPAFTINDKPLDKPYLPIFGSTEYQIPSMFSIELTNYCNYSCRHCYNNSNPKNNSFIDVDELINFLSFIKQFKPCIELTGGEPLSHPEIKKILDYTCKNFPNVNLITNGSLAGDHINLLSKYNNLVALISLYSYREEYMDWFTNTKGYYNIVMDNIKKLVSNGTHCVGTMLITPANVDDIYPTVKMIKELCVDSFRSGVILPVGRAKNQDLDFTADNIDEFNKETIRIDKDFGDFMRKIPEGLLAEHENRINCGLGVNSMSIAYNGDIKLCLMMPDFNKYTLGNVLSENDYEGLFRKISKLGLQHLKEPKKDICGDCVKSDYCEGCIARALHIYDEVDDCVWYRKIFKSL